jgi:hypothetical protein
VPTTIRVKPAVVDGMLIDHKLLADAIGGIAARHPGFTDEQELTQLTLSRARGQTDAASLLASLAGILEELEPEGEIGLEEYEMATAALAARAGNSELPPSGKHEEMDPADAAYEIARLAAEHPRYVDLLKSTAATMSRPSTVSFSAPETRMYDEPARLSAAAANAEILRLTNSRNGAMFGNTPQPLSSEDREVVRLTQDSPHLAAFFSGPDRTDVLDVGDPSISDLSGRASAPAEQVVCENNHAMDPGQDTCACGAPAREPAVDDRSVDQIVADSLARADGFFDNRQASDSSGNR